MDLQGCVGYAACLNITLRCYPVRAAAVHADEAGDAETGVISCRWTSADTGDVVSEHRYAIQPTDTANEVHDALMGLGAERLLPTCSVCGLKAV